MRCLTLAGELRTRGAHSRFICRSHAGNLIDRLRTMGYAVAALPAPAARAAATDGDYTAWLGASQQEDATQTIDAFAGEDPEWVVVDHYGIDLEWERLVRRHAGRLLVVDDLANRYHACDALLDQNYSESGEERHAGLVPQPCQLLVGVRYAMLAPEYAQHRASQRVRDGIVRRVLVYFGGADPANTTGQALAALSSPAFSHLAVDLVIGTNHPQRDALRAQAASRAGTRVHGIRPHLADLMAEADVAIGSGGGTTWERMCLGLPSLVVSIAENQRPTCEALGAAGLIAYVGNAASTDAAGIADALGALMDDRARLARLSSSGEQLVDGRGAARVVDALVEHPSADRVRLRGMLHDADVGPEGFDEFTFAWVDRCDPERVLALRNMPHVTSQMRSREPITPAQHQAFIQRYGQLDRYDFVLIDNARDRYAGVFYVTGVGSTPEIGKYVGDPQYLGMGIARRATECLLDFCRAKTDIRRLTSTTRRDNLRNIALNSGLGFVTVGAHDDYVVMALNL